MIQRSSKRRNVISNPLKRTDVFRCTHLAHKDFDFTVSAYHVLAEKKCYPDGCIDFRWHCALLKRKEKCHRGFSFVGRECHSCKYFVEEKNQRVPRLLISGEEYEEFKERVEEFTGYFEGLRGKTIDFSGTIASVKPMIVGLDDSNGRRLAGFLMRFKEGFFGADNIRSPIYAHLGTGAQQNHGLRAGDVVDFNCYAFIDRGRIVLKKIRRISVLRRGDGYLWEAAKARVAVSSGNFLDRKPRKCRSCEMGVLVDSGDGDCGRSSRRIFCMQGMDDPSECVYNLYAKHVKEAV